MSATAAVPRLTVGPPVDNGERFLAESLDALLAQTFTDFELIISDMGVLEDTSGVRPWGLGVVADYGRANDPTRGGPDELAVWRAR